MREVVNAAARQVWGVLAPHAPRRLIEQWGWGAGPTAPHEDVPVVTRDGVRLAATYLPGAADTPEAPAVVLAPGFAGHRRKAGYLLLAEALADTAAVLAVDLRGHGRSEGRCQFGAREDLDVRAAAAWLRRRGHGWVAAVGSSMGGAAVLRAAGIGPRGLLDAVCTISAPAVWGLDGSAPMRAINRMIAHGWYRTAASLLLRVRMAGGWWDPAAPLDVVARATPTPLLVVHGTDDHFFGPDQAQLLYDAAGEPKTLWLEPTGFGHPQDGFTPAFAARLARAVATVHATGRWPDVETLATRL